MIKYITVHVPATRLNSDDDIFIDWDRCKEEYINTSFIERVNCNGVYFISGNFIRTKETLKELQQLLKEQSK